MINQNKFIAVNLIILNLQLIMGFCIFQVLDFQARFEHMAQGEPSSIGEGLYVSSEDLAVIRLEKVKMEEKTVGSPLFYRPIKI